MAVMSIMTAMSIMSIAAQAHKSIMTAMSMKKHDTFVRLCCDTHDTHDSNTHDQEDSFIHKAQRTVSKLRLRQNFFLCRVSQEFRNNLLSRISQQLTAKFL